MKIYRLKIICLSLILFIFGAVSIGYGMSSSDSPSFSVGIEGYYKNGFWTPVTVSIPPGLTGEKRLKLISVDSDGTPTEISQVLDSDRQTLYLPLGKAAATLNWSISDNENNAEEGQVLQGTLLPGEGKGLGTPVSPMRPLFLIIGDDQIGLSEAMSELRMKEDIRPILLRVKNFDSLPDRWIGYEAVEMVIITSTDSAFFDRSEGKVSPSERRITALADWVRFGGKVLIAAGKDSLPLIADDGPLAPFRPGKLDSTRLREIRIANNLTQFVPKAKNLVMTGSLDSPFLEIPILTGLEASSRVRVAESETPLLVETISGFGTITFFAADLAEAPLVNWSGRSGLLLRLIGYDTDRTRKTATGTMLVHRGYEELSGQIRSNLDRFSNVRIIPFSVILLLGFLYLLLIGPFDWYLTHHLFKRPNITWFTLPCYILLFCGLVVALNSWAKSNRLEVNSLELVDYDQESGIVRGTLWGGIYSPKDERYEIALQRDSSYNLSTDKLYLSWLGLQGTCLGGMAPKTVGAGFWEAPYSIGEQPGSLKQLPIQIHASKSLIGRWLETESPLPKQITTKLKDFDGSAIGTICNPFDTPLDTAMLFYGRWAYNLGTLAPGETAIDLKTPKLERHLVIGTGPAPFATSSHNLTQSHFTAYNTESTNLPYILRAMIFYRLTGGSEFLGLGNVLQHYVDLSDQLLMGRAVLVGTMRDNSSDNIKENTKPLQSRLLPGVSTTLAISSQSEKTPINYSDHRSTVIRIISPVGKEK